MKRGGRKTCDQVWRRGWRREAAETQAAATEVAAFIRWLQQRGLEDSAGIIRQTAMQHGVRETRVDLQSAVKALCKKHGMAT
jgi:hypothetical protein